MQIYKHLSDKKLNDFQMCQLLQRCTKQWCIFEYNIIKYKLIELRLQAALWYERFLLCAYPYSYSEKNH